MAKEQVIGSLRLETDKLKKDIEEVNKILKGLGVGIELDMSKTITDAIKKQMEAMVKQAKEAGAIIQKNADLTSKGNPKVSELVAKYKELEKVAKEWAKGTDMSAQANAIHAQIEKIERENQAIKESVEVTKAKATAEAEVLIAVQKTAEAEERKAKAIAAAAEKERAAAIAKQKQEAEAAKKEYEKESAAGRKRSVADEAQKVQQVVALWKEYYQVLRQINEARANDDTDSAKRLQEELNSIVEQIKSFDVNAQKSEEVTKARAKESKAYYNEAEKAAKKAIEASNKEAEAAKKAADAKKSADDKAAKQTEKSTIKELVDLYKEMYQIEAKLASGKMGDNMTASLKARHAEIVSALSSEQRFTQEEMKAAQESKAVQKAQQAVTYATAQAADNEKKHAENTKKTTEEAQKQEATAGRILQYIKSMIIVRGLQALWQNAKEYAAEYYDAINEIQIVTLKTDQQASILADKYVRMAQAMSATATEIASAAVLFYRQGLNDSQVDDRLTWTTRFAKTASIDFEQAAKMITATTNAMSADIQGDVQRVTDVFLYLGDNAATSAEEVATAMQKASASAGTYGVSFEWLGSYIAAVSENTRQAAEVIGTSFNSIIARLHSIKQKGFNEEDATKINDVAKALSNVGIALLNTDGSWRDMTDIFQDIADKWDTMDAKMRSYIATVLAGTRQQNTFIALMSDMAKGAENGSRVFELYEGAIASAGTTMEKYAVWEESIEAASNRMTAQLQELYGKVFDEDFFQGLYGTIEDIVGAFNDVLDVWDGWLVKGPLIAAGIVALTKALYELNGVVSLVSNHPYAAIAAVAITLIGTLTAVASSIETQEKRYEKFSDIVDEASESITRYQAYQKNINTSFEKNRLSVEDLTESTGKYYSIVSELCAINPNLLSTINDVKNGYISEKDAVDQINNALQEQIDKRRELAANALIGKYSNWSSESMNDSVKSGSHIDDWWNVKNSDGTIDYATTLKNTYYAQSTRNKFTWGGLWKNLIGLLTPEHMEAEFYDKVTAVLDNLKPLNLPEDKLWEIVWSEVAPSIGMDANGEISGTIKDQIETIISDVINTLYRDQTSTSKSIMHDLLYKMIVGDDNILSNEELNNIGKTVANYIAQLGNVFEVSDIDYANYIIDNLFSEKTQERYRNLMSEPGAQDVAKSLREGYEKLLADGFSDASIDNIFANAEANQLGDITSAVMNVFQARMGEYYSRKYEDMPTSVINMVEQLMDAGTTAEEVNNILRTSTGPEEFAYRISHMTQELTGAVDAEEASTKTVVKFKMALDAVGDASSFLTDISKGEKSLMEMLSTAQELADSYDSDSFTSWTDFVKGFNADGSPMWDEQAVHNFAEELLNIADEQGQLGDNSERTKQMLLDMVKAEEKAVEATNKLSAAFDSIGNASSFLTGISNGKSTFTEMMKTAQAMADESTSDAYKSWADFISFDNGSFEWNDQAAIDYAKNMVDAYLEQDDVMKVLGENIDIVREAMYGMIKAEEELKTETEDTSNTLKQLAEDAQKSMDENWASSNGYSSEIAAISDAFSSGGIDAAVEKFGSFSGEIRKAIANEFPSLITALYDASAAQKNMADGSDSAAKAESKFIKQLGNAQKYLKAKNFKDTAKATKELRDGTISVADAYEDFYKESDNVLKAMEDITDVNKKMSDGTEVTASDVSNLEKVLGMSANDILANWDNVQAEMNSITSASGEAMNALNALNEAAFIRITGTSDVDFSDLQNGLVTTQGMAKDVIDMLVATGQFEVQTVPLNQEAWVWNNGVPSLQRKTGMFQIIKPTGNNPFKGVGTTKTNTDKKGGGGGGDSSKKGMTEVERMLDRQSQYNDFRDSAKSFYEAQAGYNEQTGRIQGVIKYYELQRDKLGEMNTALEEYLVSVEDYMKVKSAELATLQNGTEEYEEVADDLDKLQKAHQEYTQQIVENKTEIEELTEAIKEQRDAIRQMEIDLRELIYSAIEDRNQKMEDMLDAEVDMENEILDIIRERYEKERDLTLELADERIDALEREKDLIQEELDMRREQAEEEDKLTQLNQLEAKYARISADPTRKKEALEIQKEINELREEMAWDTAEKEAKAQQDAIDEQIKSIEDYKEYVEDYYEDLFAHPQKLIDEMESIISRTDQEIIDWLAENNEEYAAATENAKQIMVNGWQDALDTMRGQIRAYWDEVEQIIAGGDDAIISFLMENSADYAAAGKLQAEAYVDEWKKQLENLHKAYLDVQAEAAAAYQYIAPSEGKGNSSGGGGGSGSSGKSGHGYKFTYAGNDVSKTGFKSEEEAREAAFKEISRLAKAERDASVKAHPNGGTVYEYENTQINNREKYAKSGLMSYMNGGYADFTGPAWLDGTPDVPEYILNGEQTKIFERFVDAMMHINIPSMPNLGNYDTGTGRESYVIENITVNVDNLNTDDDYDELAEKVGEALMDKMSRGTVVGGIRTGR